MPAQGELRGPRRGGGDWDSHAEDIAVVFVEPQPGDRCTEWLPHSGPTRELRQCVHWAPVGLSICTPCHRRRIKERAQRLSLEHRQRIAVETGRPIEEIR